MREIEIQLSGLKNLQGFLLQFREALIEKSTEFKRKMWLLCEDGVPVQVVDNYATTYGNQNLQHLQNLIASITENDLPYINAKIAELEQLMILRGKTMVYKGYSGTPLYRIEGNMVYKEFTGIPLYRIEGNMVYKEYTGIPLYRIEGNMIYKEYTGIPLFRIEGNMIYEGYSGKILYRLE